MQGLHWEDKETVTIICAEIYIYIERIANLYLAVKSSGDGHRAIHRINNQGGRLWKW